MQHSRAAIVLFGYYAFTLLTAVMTAAGRIDPAEDSLFAARQLRYISVPQMNWAVLILITFWISSASKRRILVPAFSILFSLGCLIAFVKLDRWFSVAVAGSFEKEREAALSIENGNIDRELITNYVYPDFNAVSEGMSRLRAAGLSIYYRSSSTKR